MLRRTKNQILNGKPLLELPERILKLVECTFSASEKEFYRLLEIRMTSEVNKLVQSEHVNYTHVLVLLLRLRQGERRMLMRLRKGLTKLGWSSACNHPSLVSKDYHIDKDAAEPKAAKDEDDADDLAVMFGQLGMLGGKKCQLCQTPSVVLFSSVHTLLTLSTTAFQRELMQHSAKNANLLPESQNLPRAYLQRPLRSKKSCIS